MIPVDVIVTFNTLGNIKPNYIRLEDENNELHTYKIQHVEYFKEEKRAGIENIIFVCSIDINELSSQIKLTYNVTSHKWLLL